MIPRAIVEARFELERGGGLGGLGRNGAGNILLKSLSPITKLPPSINEYDCG
jgi:hypothetical protein